MTQKIRTALLGYGLAGSVFHGPSLQALGDFSVEVIVTNNSERQNAARAAFPEARILSRSEWSAAEAQLDLVVVATPPASHVALAQEALEAGCAVVVDKPFTVTSAEGQALLDFAKQRGLLLTTYQNRRYDGEYLTLRKLMDAGALGEIRRFESRLERWQQGITKEWKAQATPAEGGGILYDLGTHAIDQALQLFGPAVRVYGEISARRVGELSDDDAFVALEHEGGVISHLWMNLSVAANGPRFRVLGSEAAYVKVNGDQQEAQLKAGILPGDPDYGVDPQSNWGVIGLGENKDVVRTENASFTDFYAELAQAILHNGAVPVDPADSIATLRIIETVRAQVAASTR